MQLTEALFISDVGVGYVNALALEQTLFSSSAITIYNPPYFTEMIHYNDNRGLHQVRFLKMMHES